MAIPQLSVLMTVYNGERHIAETMQSILRQSFVDYEFIVVDDGSTDNTFGILSVFANRDSRIQLLRNPINQGIVYSMNKLFRLAQGFYVTRHDGDDISLPGRFEQQVQYLEENPGVGLVASNVEIIDNDGNQLDLDKYSGPSDNASIQRELRLHCVLCQTSVMFRRQLLDLVGLYDAALEPAEDYDLWLRMAEVTLLSRLPIRLCKYRIHSDSISHRRSGIQYRGSAEALTNMASRRYNLNIPVEIKAAAAKNFIVAADWFCKANDLESTHQCLVKALTLYPALFTSDKSYVPFPETETKFQFANSLFQAAGHFPNKSKVRKRFLSRLYMKQVFEAVGNDSGDVIDSHLWIGLRSDPRWLINRGVISIAIRSALRHIRRRLSL